MIRKHFKDPQKNLRGSSIQKKIPCGRKQKLINIF